MNTNNAKKHQDFLIAEQRDGKRLKIVRQDRESVEAFECFVEIHDKLYKVKNVSSFGLLIDAEGVLFSNETEAKFIVSDVILGQYKLKPVRKNYDDGFAETAFEILDGSISISTIKLISRVESIIDDHYSMVEEIKRIPVKFSHTVYEVKDFLTKLRSDLDELELNLDKRISKEGNSFELEVICQMVGSYINKFMPAKNNQVNSLLVGASKDEVQACFKFFREKLKDLIYTSPFSNRVFYKPSGYAGDYEMMNIIYRSEPEGRSLFDKCMHNYWVTQPAAQAVRNRASYLIRKVDEVLDESNDEKKILSVACGPAMEWQRILSRNNVRKNISLDLLDQDINALKSTQKILNHNARKHSVNIQYLNKAIKNIIARGLDSKYDLIYSAGLFDYFSAPVAKLAAEKLYQSLNPGGKLIIGNFNTDNPNSLTMDLALDWHLIYRSPNELVEMLKVDGASISVEKEDLNINLFCILEKR